MHRTSSTLENNSFVKLQQNFSVYAGGHSIKVRFGNGKGHSEKWSAWSNGQFFFLQSPYLWYTTCIMGKTLPVLSGLRAGSPCNERPLAPAQVDTYLGRNTSLRGCDPHTCIPMSKASDSLDILDPELTSVISLSDSDYTSLNVSIHPGALLSENNPFCLFQDPGKRWPITTSLPSWCFLLVVLEQTKQIRFPQL